MLLTGEGIWSEPKDVDQAECVLKRAAELEVSFIDTLLQQFSKLVDCR
jgi:pyridoxine 4-dehydrogenase